MRMPELKPGMSCTVQKVITMGDTALNYGSGALKNLLATPVLAALMIEAAVKMVDPMLPEECITIGKSIEIEHSNPTMTGMTVTVGAKLVEINGTRLLFEIHAYDEIGEIGSGYHERYIVNYDKLMNKAYERCDFVMGNS
jgi:predicted thioesterase